MNTRPNTSQADRDVLDDVGLPDFDDRVNGINEPVLLSHTERTAS